MDFEDFIGLFMGNLWGRKGKWMNMEI